MDERSLSDLLRSPALDLEPPPSLAVRAVAGARRVRRRRAAGTVALSVALVAGAAVVAPQLVGGTRVDEGQVALAPDSRFPQATTAVVQLVGFNQGEVLTWFQGTQWCTAAARVSVVPLCSRPVGATVAPFAFIRDEANETTRIDEDGVVTGLLGDGVDAVDVRFTDGATVRARTREAEGFVRPVWWVLVPRPSAVEAVVALDAAGEVVATLPRRR